MAPPRGCNPMWSSRPPAFGSFGGGGSLPPPGLGRRPSPNHYGFRNRMNAFSSVHAIPGPGKTEPPRRPSLSEVPTWPKAHTDARRAGREALGGMAAGPKQTTKTTNKQAHSASKTSVCACLVLLCSSASFWSVVSFCLGWLSRCHREFSRLLRFSGCLDPTSPRPDRPTPLASSDSRSVGQSVGVGPVFRWAFLLRRLAGVKPSRSRSVPAH